MQKYSDDEVLKKYVESFNFSDYAIFRPGNKELYYLDDVNDLIKNGHLKHNILWESKINDLFKKRVKPGSIAIDLGDILAHIHSIFPS